MSNKNIGEGVVSSSTSNDVLKLIIEIDEDNIFESIDYKIFGRPESVEAARSLPVLLVGLDIEEAVEMEPEDIGFDEDYAELVLQAINAAVNDFLYKKRADYDGNADPKGREPDIIH